MNSTPQEIQQLTEKIIGCAIEVHRVLGPGLLESVYRECLLIELRREHLRAESERQIALDYKGIASLAGFESTCWSTSASSSS